MKIAERNNKLKHFITCLKCEVSGKCCNDNCSTQYDAGNMGEIIENLEAISKVLEQEPFVNKSCVSSEVCEHDKQMVLGKIRAEMFEEMLSHSGTGEEVIQAYVDGLKKGLDILDKYKAESEET